MIEVLRKIWRFAGEEQGNIRKSMVLGFFYAIFHMFQIGAIYVVVLALVDGSTSAAPAWEALVLLLVSILGRAIMNRFSQLQQTHAGYFMAANKRLHMGDKLKRIPMGYFNDQSLGELTGIATTVLDEVESAGAMVLAHQLRRHAAVRAVLGLAHRPAGPGRDGGVPAAPLPHGAEVRQDRPQAPAG